MTADNPPSDWQNLARENGSLRAIITELLITNQELRWKLLAYSNGSVRPAQPFTNSVAGSLAGSLMNAEESSVS